MYRKNHVDWKVCELCYEELQHISKIYDIPVNPHTIKKIRQEVEEQYFFGTDYCFENNKLFMNEMPLPSKGTVRR